MKRLILCIALLVVATAGMGAKQAKKPLGIKIEDRKGRASYSIRAGDDPVRFNARVDPSKIVADESYVTDDTATLGTLYGKNAHKFSAIKGEKGPGLDGDFTGDLAIKRLGAGKQVVRDPKWRAENGLTVENETWEYIPPKPRTIVKAKPGKGCPFDGAVVLLETTACPPDVDDYGRPLLLQNSVACAAYHCTWCGRTFKKK